MAFDWKQLEREESERQLQAARSMGIGWLVIGVVGTVVVFLITGAVDWVNAAIFLVIGLAMFGPAAVVMRRRSKGRDTP
jgi:uncharacterized membrane protein YhaH (DUF805 family)